MERRSGPGLPVNDNNQMLPVSLVRPAISLSPLTTVTYSAVHFGRMPEALVKTDAHRVAGSRFWDYNKHEYSPQLPGDHVKVCHMIRLVTYVCCRRITQISAQIRYLLDLSGPAMDDIESMSLIILFWYSFSRPFVCLRF